MAYSIATKFSINFVAKHWLLEKYQDEDLGIQPLINLSTRPGSCIWQFTVVPTTIIRSNESANLFSVSCIVSNVAYSSLYTAAKNAMQKKKAYAETIGIACKAINITIEKEDLQVLKFLKGYIFQNKHSLVENMTIVCSSSSRTNILEERSEPNIIFEKPQVKVTNPIKKVRRGRLPKVARYQSSLENQTSKVQGKRPKLIRGPGTNTCGNCGGKDHNRRWHTKHENKACDSTITCEFCGGSGYSKELHKNDSAKINELEHSINDENEWIDSSSSESEEVEMDIK
ncbi:hypothetical protein F8M41_010925 [Gigaspora margarita]|uniref:Uncharacterized protein n=1 Tax=Gigaspora margarita TaxID=4874 RepID=A0A8H3X109_GIGMA|nr:hypothetical protein F8M41_010925 [Gigaspora margarita]